MVQNSESEEFKAFKRMYIKRKREERALADFKSGRLVELKNKLIIHTKSGKAVYFGPSGKKYEHQFDVRDNTGKVLIYLASHPSGELDAATLAKLLNKPRHDEVGNTDDRRVRDTFQSLRKGLGLVKNPDDCFQTARGFGLKCSVELLN